MTSVRLKTAPQVHVPRIRHWDGDLDLLDKIGASLVLPQTA